MLKNLRARGLIGVGYLAFGGVSLLLFLWLTFPYEVLRQRLITEAREAGMNLAVQRVGPSFGGVRLRSLQLIPDGTDGLPDTTRALVVDALSLRPSLLPMGVRARADLMGGDLVAHLGLLGDPSVRVDIDGLNTQRGNFLGYTGLDLDGLLDGNLNVSMPRLPSGEPDLSKADGTFSLLLADTRLNGGTLPGSFPLDLPSARIGDLQLELPIEDGVGALVLSGNGEDLQLQGEGSVNLARQLGLSRLDVQVKLRASPEFVQAQPMIGMGLNTLPADPTDPSFRQARVAGTLSRPSFTPGR